MTVTAPANGPIAGQDELARRKQNTVTLLIPTLHCASCMAKVERALNAMPGVSHARVNLTRKRVTAHTRRTTEELILALKRAGYEAHALDQTVISNQNGAAERSLLLRLGVAGFAMMNVMLLSVAVWSGATEATRDLFHLISAAIALPAALYAAQPFFANAMSALRARQLNMDVPISLAIILAGGMSLFEALSGGHHAYFDAALSLTFFLLIGRYLESRSRAAARSAASELAALEVQDAQKCVGDRVETVPVSALQIGDRLMIATGQRIPVDGTLESGTALTDRSFLTGESIPVASRPGETLRAGEINLGSPVTLKATAVGEDTSLRRMVALVETAENARNRYTSLADRAARIYAPLVHLLALAALIGWYMQTGDFRLSLNVAIAVLIITCPCALGLAVPAVATAAIGRLYSMGFLVKSGTALERVAETDTWVFDKTGTLTTPGFAFDTETLNQFERGVAASLSQTSNHPVAQALAAHLATEKRLNITDLKEIAGKGVSGQLDGRPVYIGQDRRPDAETGEFVLEIGNDVYELARGETLRPGAQDAINGLNKRGLSAQILSGDAPERAAEIAQTLGVSGVRGAVSGVDKHQAIQDLTTAGHKVCMVGDGLNDTGALASAHASVAPASALDAARSSADIVLVRESLKDLPLLFSVARKASRIARQNFAIAAAYNAVAIPVALSGHASPLMAALAMSCSSLTVLLNALRVRRVS